MSDNLGELVDKAIPSGGAVNSEQLHKLLHVIVHNLSTVNEIKMDYKCTSGGKPPSGQSGMNKDDLALIHDKVKDLAEISEEQRQLLAELEGKIVSLEGELNKVSESTAAVLKQCGKCGKSISSREKERPVSKTSGR